ncbi:hypothetical protein BUE80_DR009676 [Diplocarpon rosae]|nr:hypothetical protein BUE80_DR009676 [Diplocarpon rosae]
MASIAAETTYYMLPRHMSDDREDVDFPLYPDPNMFSHNFPFSAAQNFNTEPYAYPRTQDGYSIRTTSSSVAPFADATYPHESPDLRAVPSNYSTASGPSAASSAMGSPNSIHGHIVTAPEWPPHGLGLDPGIVSYENFAHSNEYTYHQPTGMDDFALEVAVKPNGFVGECKNISRSVSRQHVSKSSNCDTFSTSFSVTPPTMNVPGGQTRVGVASMSMASQITPVSVAAPASRDNGFTSPKSAFSKSLRASTASSGASSSPARAQDLRSPIFAISHNLISKTPSCHARYHQPIFFSQASGSFIPPLESLCRFPLATPASCHDPSILHPQYTVRATPATQCHDISVYPPPTYSGSPSLSHMSRSPRPVKQGSQSPYSYSSNYPYPARRRPSIQSYGSQDGNFSSEESKEKGRCTYPECGKVFKDLKAHMLTHQNERPEKCPIQTCDYHTKGFARKYDKNRHTLTHYKGTMVCGFCPGSGSAAEKSFNRADVFKRHLTSVHAVEQTPPNSRKKISSSINSTKSLSGYAPDATGKCSTCSGSFGNAQDFYEHLDDCVLRIVQQEEPSEAINAARLAEVEQDHDVHQTLRHHALPLTTTTTSSFSADEDEDDEESVDENDDDFTLRNKSRKNKNRNPANGVQKSRGLTHSKGNVTLHPKGRKKRKDYPSSWGAPTSQMKMKTRVLCVFDGSRRLWQDDMMLDTDYEVRMKLQNEKAYVTDLDVQTMRRADALHQLTEEEKGPWVTDDLTGIDLEKLMEVTRE